MVEGFRLLVKPKPATIAPFPAPLAQLDRALPSEGRGQTFESSGVHHERLDYPRSSFSFLEVDSLLGLLPIFTHSSYRKPIIICLHKRTSTPYAKPVIISGIIMYCKAWHQKVRCRFQGHIVVQWRVVHAAQRGV